MHGIDVKEDSKEAVEQCCTLIGEGAVCCPYAPQTPVPGEIGRVLGHINSQENSLSSAGGTNRRGEGYEEQRDRLFV